MNSSWDKSKLISNYHFDNKTFDPTVDRVIELGNIVPNWTEDLPDIIERSRPATWATRGYKGEGIEAPPAELATEEYDLERAGYDRNTVITHLNWAMPDSLQRVSDFFGLADCMNRIHIQMPGELWNLHIDKLYKWCPENPERVMRIMIQLTDWQPGQFWEYGTYHHNRWSAGEVTTFDWANLPHSTANAGHHPRVTLQITGVITDTTTLALEKLANDSIINIDRSARVR
jgi:hypothetical protein